MAAGAVITVLLLIKPAAIWWAILLLTSAMVLALEAMNSALERLIDHLHPDIHPEIGMVKDMAAGAVLLSSIIALAIAACLIVAIT